MTGTRSHETDLYGREIQNGRHEKLLVINCGSSSVKYSFYDTEDESRQAGGKIERIGIDGTRLQHRGPQGVVTQALPKGQFSDAFEAVAKHLSTRDAGQVESSQDLTLVVHRVVHGGEKFTEAVLITDAILAEIEALNPLAPLHNPVNVAGIREMRRLFPAASHVAVFDTAFHHTLPPEAYLYGLPYELYQKHGLRRYGFHGTSHHYVSLRASDYLNSSRDKLRMISCHLGNGASVCAIADGFSVDTSMGFTPAEGLIMGTRCGDVDIGVIAFLERSEGFSASQSEDLLNKRSGLLGLSGLSSDMREVQTAAAAGQNRALLTLKAYCYRLRKYIGAYAAALGGLDVIIFTGGVGEGSSQVRALTLQGLHSFGIALDETFNLRASGTSGITRISSHDSRVAVLVIPTDEEKMMAIEALRLLSRTREEAIETGTYS